MDNQLLITRPKVGFGFVYSYTAPDGKKYIGQSKKTLKDRAGLHAKSYKGTGDFYRAIQKYGLANFKVEIIAEVPLDVLTESELQEIVHYKTYDPEYGYNVIDERLNYLLTVDAIPVYCYDSVTGAYVNGYANVGEAERSLGAYYGTIRRAINTSCHTAKDYFWRTFKADSIEVPADYVRPVPRTICMYNVESGDFIQEFASIREAARSTIYTRQQISGEMPEGSKHVFKTFKVDNLYRESSTTIQNEVGEIRSTAHR